MTPRLITTALVVAAIASFTASVAAAGWAPSNAVHFDGRSPDTRDAARAAHFVARFKPNTPATQARQIAQGSIDESLHKSSVSDGRSPDTKDAARLAHSSKISYDGYKSSYSQLHELHTMRTPALSDGRSPDTKDAAAIARQTPSPVIIVGAKGFDWTDAGIGAAAGFGLAVIAASGLALTRHRRVLPAS
jgi:hypothetical protein